MSHPAEKEIHSSVRAGVLAAETDFDCILMMPTAALATVIHARRVMVALLKRESEKSFMFSSFTCSKMMAKHRVLIR
jgi:hypothetical protein